MTNHTNNTGELLLVTKCCKADYDLDDPEYNTYICANCSTYLNPEDIIENSSAEPDWVCSDCGNKYGNRKCGIATFHIGTCGVCGEEKEVTEPRDYGYLSPITHD